MNSLLTELPTFEEHYIPHHLRKTSKRLSPKRAHINPSDEQRFFVKHKLKKHIHSNESFFEALYLQDVFTETIHLISNTLNIDELRKRLFLEDTTDIKNIVKALVTYEWYQDFPHEITLNRAFQCYFFSDQQAWFSKDNIGQVRYFSRFRQGDIFSIGLIDMLQIITKKRYTTLIREFKNEPYIIKKSNRQMYLYHKLSQRIPALKRNDAMYRILMRFKHIQREKTFDEIESDEIRFFINYSFLGKQLGVSRQYITRQIQLLENYGLLTIVKKNHLSAVEQRYVKFQEMIFLEKAESTMLIVHDLSEHRINHILEQEAIVRTNKINKRTLEEKKTPLIDQRNKNLQRIINHLTHALKKRPINEKMIRTRWKNEKDVYQLYRKNKKEIQEQIGVEFRRLKKKEKERCNLSPADNSYYYIPFSYC